MKIVALGQALIHEPVTWHDSLRDLVKGADAVICNFEGCLPPDGAWPMKSKTVHAAHPDALLMLRDLGVTHLALANNHAWDYGHAGILETRRLAEAAGFAVAGVGVDLATAMTPALATGVAMIAVDAGPTPDWAIAGRFPGVAPLRLRMLLGLPPSDLVRLREITAQTGEATRRLRRAEVGFDPQSGALTFYGQSLTEAEIPEELWQPDGDDLNRLLQAVNGTREAGHLVLVALHYHHWSTDWLAPPRWLQVVADALLSVGATAVLCTGPPFTYPPKLDGASAIAPSLGNLVFHTRRSTTYDILSLPVWQGLALVFENDCWRLHCIDVIGPSKK